VCDDAGILGSKKRSTCSAFFLIPESCTNYRSEAQKALGLKRSWSDFDLQAYDLYGEDQNHETSFKGKALQAVGDNWCKIQVMTLIISKIQKLPFPYMK
jgi:hypothetical protein